MKLFYLILLLFAAGLAHGQCPMPASPAGTLDLCFDPGTGFADAVQCVEVQPDRKILVGGRFRSYQGVEVHGIIRLNENGSIDSSFRTGTGFNSEVFDLALAPDGKIWACGTFTNYNGTLRYMVARLNPDGTVDSSFSPPHSWQPGFDNRVSSMALQPDGKLVLGGWFKNYTRRPVMGMARLFPDGRLDTTFNAGSGFDWGVHTVALLPDGKFLAGGRFDTCQGRPRNFLARIHSDGRLDTTFNPSFVPNDTNGSMYIKTVVVQPDQRILIAGSFITATPDSSVGIMRLLADGAVDPDFHFTPPGPHFLGNIHDLALQSDGRIILVGGFNDFQNGINPNRILGLYPNGIVDQTFQIGTGFSQGGFGYVHAIALTPDGKAVTIGDFHSYNGVIRRSMARLFAPADLAGVPTAWQPLQAGFTYFTGDTAHPFPPDQQLSTDSASPDGSEIYLGFSFRSDPATGKGFRVPGIFQAAQKYQRDHVLGRMCRKQVDGHWEYVIRQGRSLLALPIHGGVRVGDSISVRPDAWAQMVEKRAQIIDGQPDSVLTYWIKYWAVDSLSGVRNELEGQAEFSKNHGIRKFPRPALEVPGLLSVARWENQHSLKAFPTGSQPGLPMRLRDWVDVRPGDTLWEPSRVRYLPGGAYEQVARALLVDSVSIQDSGLLQQEHFFGLGREISWPVRPPSGSNQFWERTGPPVITTPARTSLEKHYYAFNRFGWESATPLYQYKHGPDGADSAIVDLVMANEYSGDTAITARHGRTHFKGMLYKGNLFFYEGIFETSGNFVLRRGPGFDFETTQYCCPPTFDREDFIRCIGRPGTGTHCGTVDRMMGVESLVKSQIRAFPNPVSNTLYFEGLPAGSRPIRLYNVQGRLTLTQNLDGQKVISVKELPPGLYQWRCGVYSGKIVKE